VPGLNAQPTLNGSATLLPAPIRREGAALFDHAPDPEDSMGSYYLCAFMRYGCLWSARWLPGGEMQARAARESHEQGCIYRFHAPRP
jgi:hypothetical protein